MIQKQIDSSKWAQFYINRLNDDYYHHVCTRYRPFLNEVLRYIQRGSSIVELGCGMGNVSRFLLQNSDVKFKATMIDNDFAMIWLSLANLNKFDPNALGRTAYLIHGDILKSCPLADVVHSHGVLEHFSDEQIRTVIEIQKKACNTLIHYVPSYKYMTPSFGDERLMTPEQWKAICNPTEIIEFNDGYDLILKWTK